MKLWSSNVNDHLLCDNCNYSAKNSVLCVWIVLCCERNKFGKHRFLKNLSYMMIIAYVLCNTCMPKYLISISSPGIISNQKSLARRSWLIYDPNFLRSIVAPWNEKLWELLCNIKSNVNHGLWHRWVAGFQICPSVVENIFNPSEKQGNSAGFDSCDWPSNLTQIRFKSSIYQPVWPWNLMDDPQNIRASLLCYFKFFASFRSHWWIQTGVTVRKRLIWVKIDFF